PAISARRAAGTIQAGSLACRSTSRRRRRSGAAFLFLGFAEIDDLHAAIATARGIVGIDELALAEADRLEMRRLDAELLDEIVLHRIGALLREFFVGLLGADGVGMPGDEE